MFDMNQDLFDSRDVIERIEELEALEAAALDDDATQDDVDEWTRELDAELFALREFAEDASNASDWSYGETFIHESYFTEYTKELVSDCGYIPADLPDWIKIDWEETAENVMEDYTEYELDGNTYYAR